MAGLNLGRLTLISLFLLQFTADGQRLRDSMYQTLYGGGACYRRLNGTHQTGCSSGQSGTVGTVHVVEQEADMAWVLSEEARGGPYALVLPLLLFTSIRLDRLLDTPDNIAGIIVINNGTHKPESFSPESPCPNEYSQAALPGQCSSGSSSSHWNPQGSSLSLKDYPFSMFYLPPERREDIDAIYECFERFNNFDLKNQQDRSLCAVDMNAFMFAAVNTAVCHRRYSQTNNLNPVRFCDPMGDRSVYYPLYPRKANVSDSDAPDDAVKNGTDLPGSVILVTANMDSSSLFQGAFTGISAMTTVSGLVTLMASAQLLHLMLPDNAGQYENNVIFMLLNGESYDYIGSQRLAWDLVQGDFPYGGPVLSPAALGVHLHLAQLSADPLTAFTPKYQDQRDIEVETFLRWFTNPQDNVNISVSRGESLPPSPLHPFSRQLNSSVAPSLASIALASHGSQFKNRFYQSILDDVENLGYKYLNLSLGISKDSPVVFPDADVPANSIQMRLANISTNIARALYRHVTGTPYVGQLKASPYIVDELIHCYMDTSACLLLNASQTPPAANLPAGTPPLSLYVGVALWPTPATLATAHLLSLLTADPLYTLSRDDCHSGDNRTGHYSWMGGYDGNGVCMQYRTDYTEASSPAFFLKDYDFASGEFSTWSESVWNQMSLRLLVRPASTPQAVVLGLGVSVALLSVILVLLVRRHVNLLLNPASRDAASLPSSSQVDC